MLGTGRGCLKPPDIILHGSGVGPQHCFIERNPIDNEVTLHPISQLTSVNDSPISGPTPLLPGSVINIGGIHSFRFDGPSGGTVGGGTRGAFATNGTASLKSTVNYTNGNSMNGNNSVNLNNGNVENVYAKTHGLVRSASVGSEKRQDTGILQQLQQIKQQKLKQQHLENERRWAQNQRPGSAYASLYDLESPYAVINSPGAGNPVGSAGDVNKNVFQQTMKIMDPAGGLPSQQGPVLRGKDEAALQVSSSSLSSLGSRRFSPLLEDSGNGYSAIGFGSSATATSTPLGYYNNSHQFPRDRYTPSSPRSVHRDGLESEHFVNKVARFEHLTQNGTRIGGGTNGSGIGQPHGQSPPYGSSSGDYSNKTSPSSHMEGSLELSRRCASERSEIEMNGRKSEEGDDGRFVNCRDTLGGVNYMSSSGGEPEYRHYYQPLSSSSTQGVNNGFRNGNGIGQRSSPPTGRHNSPGAYVTAPPQSPSSAPSHYSHPQFFNRNHNSSSQGMSTTSGRRDEFGIHNNNNNGTRSNGYGEYGHVRDETKETSPGNGLSQSPFVTAFNRDSFPACFATGLNPPYQNPSNNNTSNHSRAPDQHDDNSSPNHYSSSSPDSFTSLNRHHQRNHNGNANLASPVGQNGTNSTRFNNNGGFPSDPPDSPVYRSNGEGGGIPCETLLEFKRRQAEEARRSAELSESADGLKLEEVLAMCQEYEEQISREIKEKTPPANPIPAQHPTFSQQPRSVSINSNASFNTNISGKNEDETGRQIQPRFANTDNNGMNGNSSADLKIPGTPTLYGYSRIKTNGSLPREKSYSSGSSSSGSSSTSSNTSSQGSNNNNTSFGSAGGGAGGEISGGVLVGPSSSSSCRSISKNEMRTTDDEISSIFTFSPNPGIRNDVFLPCSNSTPTCTNNKPSPQISAPSFQRSTLPDDVDSLYAKPNKIGLRKGVKSGYENVILGGSPSGPNGTTRPSFSSSTAQNNNVDLCNLSPICNTSSRSSNGNPNGSSSAASSYGSQKPGYESTTSPRTRIRTTFTAERGTAGGSEVQYSANSNSKSSAGVNAPNELFRRPIITTVLNSVKSSSETGGSGNDSLYESVGEKQQSEKSSKSKQLSVSFSDSVQEFDEHDSIRTNDLKPSVDDLNRGGNQNGETRVKRPSPEPPQLPPKTNIIATQVQVHSSSGEQNNNNNNDETGNNNIIIDNNKATVSHVVYQSIQSSLVEKNGADSISLSTCDSSSNNSRTTQNLTPSPFPLCVSDSRTSLLKKDINEVEQQEMEALQEMEIEKALLLGEEKSLESQLISDMEEAEALKDKLSKIDESNRRWKATSLENILGLKTRLGNSEKEIDKIEKILENFEGTQDEETRFLERLKFQHDTIDSDRKAFEDAEFHHMEEEINREGQREEVSKSLADINQRVLSQQLELEQLRSQNRISFGSSAQEIQALEKRRQELIKALEILRNSKDDRVIQLPDHSESLSDSEELKNAELEEKLRSLSLYNAFTEDAMKIERIKSRSPIDPRMGSYGTKTCETLREIGRNREYLLNEQGAQMLEEERQRVRELQKRVQDAVREEWEASRKNRNNQCHSLNSVGSEDSTQTVSDTPTDSNNSDDTTDKSAAPSLSTDMSFNITSGRDTEGISPSSMEGHSDEMRQKQRDTSQAYDNSTRPLSDSSAYDNAGSIVTMREKHRIQDRPLTRYLPVRGDEEAFDLRAHIESSGHQLELCPSVIVTSTTARGFLSKLGSRFHNWNKRWFVFDRETRTLSYYMDRSEKKSRGGVHFQAIEEVYVDHLQSVKTPHPKLTFCVKTYNRVFHLVAPSPEAMRIWVDVIFTGAEGYQEFKRPTS